MTEFTELFTALPKGSTKKVKYWKTWVRPAFVSKLTDEITVRKTIQYTNQGYRLPLEGVHLTIEYILNKNESKRLPSENLFLQNIAKREKRRAA